MVIVGSEVIVLRSTETLTDSYDGTIWVGPGTSEQLWVGRVVGREVVTVGAGVEGDGDEFWTHPAARMQTRNVRKTRRRDAIFMARDLYHYLLTSLSHFFQNTYGKRGYTGRFSLWI
jgi:hypothetical protein